MSQKGLDALFKRANERNAAGMKPSDPEKVQAYKDHAATVAKTVMDDFRSGKVSETRDLGQVFKSKPVLAAEKAATLASQKNAMQQKKDEARTAGYARNRANNAQKEYEDYIASDEYRQNQQERNRQHQKDLLLHRLMTGTADTFGPALKADEKEEQLKKEAEEWKKRADAEDREKESASNRETIASMTEEERALLDRYTRERRDAFAASLDQTRTSTVNFEDNPLIQRYGRDRLDKLADLYTEEKNRASYLEAQQKGAEEANKGVAASAWGSAKTVGANLAGSLLSPLSRIAESGGRMESMPAYSAGDVLYGYSSGLRGQVAQNISGDQYNEQGEKVSDGGLARQLASYAYQGGMSAADSAARLAVTGNAGVAAGLAAMGSFNTTLSEAREKGATPGQAVALATATAGIEALTEKLPLDNLMDIVAGGGKGVVKNILKQTITEIGEEEASLVLSLLAEAAILREKSGYNQRIQELTAQGMSEEEARKQANMELLKEAGETALISGISGNMSAVVAQTANRMANRSQNVQQTAPQQEVVQDTQVQEETQPQVQQEIAQEPQLSNEAETEQDTAAAEPAPAQQAENQAPAENPDLQMNESKEQTAEQEQEANPISAAWAKTMEQKAQPEAKQQTPAQAAAEAFTKAVQPKEQTTTAQPEAQVQGEGIKGTGAAERDFSGKADYQELLYEGNVQPDRPGDVRPMEVPKTDTAGKRVTEFAADAYGADITTDDMAGQIESLIQSGDMSFDTRTNQQSLQNAVETVKKKGGPASARKEITRNIEKGRIRDGDIETAILLYSTYAQKGKTDEASEMLVDLAQMANITGRNLQLFKLLRRMTVEGQVMALQKEVRRSVDRMIKSGQVKAGYTTEFDPELVENYRKAMERLRVAKTAEEQKQAEQDAKRAQDAIYLAEAAKMPATFKAKWDAWRYMAMLGNAKTQVRNLAGNALFVPYKVAKDNMAALAELAFLKPENRTKGFLNLAEYSDRKLLQWAQEDGNSQTIQDALQYSAKLGDDVSGQKIQKGRTIFKSKALEDVRKFVEKVPQSGDMFFKNPYYATSLAGFIKARGYTAADVQNGNVPEAVMQEARGYAIQEAMKATFNDSNSFSDFISSLRYKGDNPWGKAANILLEGVLPFRKTPANIVVRFTEYSPVGLAKGAWDMATKVKSGKMSAATAIDELASGITGTAALGLGYLLASGVLGVKLRGSEVEEDEKRQGHQEYALEFNADGQEYSYKIDWAAPANLPLFVGANLYDLISGKGEDKSMSAFTSFVYGMGNMFEPMLALSCLSSLNDLFEAGKYSDGNALYAVAAQVATSYFTQGIPALLRQGYQASQAVKQKTFANSSDPLVRDTQRRIANIPIVGGAFQTDSITPWGEEESRGSAGRRIFDAFFNPGTRKAIDNSELERELSRLGDAQDENVNPPETAKTISYTDSDGNRHENLRLTEEQYTTLAKVQGQTAKAILDELIASPTYKAMTNAQKAKAWQDVYSYAREKGRSEALEDYQTGETWVANMETGKEAETIARRVISGDIKSAADAINEAWAKAYNAGTTQKASDKMEQAYQVIRSLGKSEREKVVDSLTGTAAKYVEAREKGISPEDFQTAAKAAKTATGTGKNGAVRDIDTREAIAKAHGLTAGEIDALMVIYMPDYDPDADSPDTTEAKYAYIRQEMGLSPAQYAQTYRAYSETGKKAEKIAAIMALGYNKATAEALYNVYNGNKNQVDYLGWYDRQK